MAVPPPNLPGYVKDLYRLRPDRRFLYAAAELARLTQSGPHSGKLEIRFEGDHSSLSLDGSQLGDLPEYPDFADAKKLLLSRVPRLETPPKADIELSAAELAALED